MFRSHPVSSQDGPGNLHRDRLRWQRLFPYLLCLLIALVHCPGCPFTLPFPLRSLPARLLSGRSRSCTPASNIIRRAESARGKRGSRSDGNALGEKLYRSPQNRSNGIALFIDGGQVDDAEAIRKIIDLVKQEGELRAARIYLAPEDVSSTWCKELTRHFKELEAVGVPRLLGGIKDPTDIRMGYDIGDTVIRNYDIAIASKDIDFAILLEQVLATGHRAFAVCPESAGSSLHKDFALFTTKVLIYGKQTRSMPGLKQAVGTARDRVESGSQAQGLARSRSLLGWHSS